MAISRFKKGVPGFGFDAFGYPLKYDTASAAGCSTKLPIPEDGLIRYAPLDKYYENTTTLGESYFKQVGNVTFETVDGVPCAYFEKESGCRFMQAYFLESTSGFTCSFWCKNVESAGTVAFCVCDSGCYDYDCTMWVSKTAAVFMSGDSKVRAEFEDNNKLRHISVRYSDGAADLFIDGSLTASAEFAVNIKTDQYYTQIAKRTNYESQPADGFKGYMSSFRIYNRALSDKEIKALSKEFKI